MKRLLVVLTFLFIIVKISTGQTSFGIFFKPGISWLTPYRIIGNEKYIADKNYYSVSPSANLDMGFRGGYRFNKFFVLNTDLYGNFSSFYGNKRVGSEMIKFIYIGANTDFCVESSKLGFYLGIGEDFLLKSFDYYILFDKNLDNSYGLAKNLTFFNTGFYYKITEKLKISVEYKYYPGYVNKECLEELYNTSFKYSWRKLTLGFYVNF